MISSATLYAKCEAIVESCNTTHQYIIAIKYIDNAIKYGCKYLGFIFTYGNTHIEDYDFWYYKFLTLRIQTQTLKEWNHNVSELVR